MGQDTEIKGRIKEIVVAMGVKQKELAVMLGVKPGTLSNIITTDQGVPGSLLKKFPQIGLDLNWLTTGKGEMWVQDKDEVFLSSIAKRTVDEMTEDDEPVSKSRLEVESARAFDRVPFLKSEKIKSTEDAFYKMLGERDFKINELSMEVKILEREKNELEQKLWDCQERYEHVEK